MKIALGIEYEGTEFSGWQFQEKLRTIQGCLEEALTRIANEPIKTFCAGRTDAGVHATGQVIHFETVSARPIQAWTMGTNTYLPPSISVQWAKGVDDSFHARFSAIARRYHYLILNQKNRSALNSKRATWISFPLDSHKMQIASQCLIGEQDFSSFRSSQCESKTPMRNIHFVNIKNVDSFIIVEIQANAFLHHMVRNIVGALIQVGSGYNPSSWISEVLEAKDRKRAGETAPAHGLYLSKVIYPEEYELPESTKSLRKTPIK